MCAFSSAFQVYLLLLRVEESNCCGLNTKAMLLHFKLQLILLEGIAFFPQKLFLENESLNWSCDVMLGSFTPL